MGTNPNAIMVEVKTETGTKMVERHKVGFRLRDAETKSGQKVLVGSGGAVYQRGDNGELIRRDRVKFGKKQKKAMKREKFKASKEGKN